MDYSESLFGSPEFSDVELLLIELETGKKKTIRAHKAILANASLFFRRLFQTTMKEGRTNIIEVRVEDLQTASKLIEWIYTHDPFVPKGSEQLAEAWLIIKPSEVPYPGVKGIFTLTEENVNLDLRFDSSTSRSTIKQLYLKKTSRTTFRVIYHFPKGMVALKEYLKQHNILLDDYWFPDGMTAMEDTKKILLFVQLVVKNNSFSQEDIKKIKEFLGNQIDFN